MTLHKKVTKTLKNTPIFVQDLFADYLAITPTSQSRLYRTAFLPSELRSQVLRTACPIGFQWKRARKRDWSDRILGSARILGVQRGDLPGGGFLYVELFDSQIQSRSRNSEFGSRATWPSNFSVAFRRGEQL